MLCPVFQYSNLLKAKRDLGPPVHRQEGAWLYIPSVPAVAVDLSPHAHQVALPMKQKP